MENVVQCDKQSLEQKYIDRTNTHSVNNIYTQNSTQHLLTYNVFASVVKIHNDLHDEYKLYM